MNTASPTTNDDIDDTPPGFIKTCKITYEAAKKYGVLDIAAHPFIYADLLIRIGYEPFTPIEQRSFWTLYSSKLILPGVVPYARYLVFTDTPRVCRTFGPSFAEKLLNRRLAQYLDERNPNSPEPPPETPQLLQRLTIENLQHFVQVRGKQLAIQMGVTILTHPLRVITVRYMASYVDQNLYFSEIFSTILNSITTEGIFTGLGPRLLADFIYGLASATVYMSTVEILQEIEVHRFFSPSQLQLMDKVVVFLSNYIAKNYSSQFHTVSDLMIVNGTPLAVGNLPFMPVYDGWFDCWKNIRSDRLYKSVSIFKRVYEGPITWEGNRQVGLDHFGPTYLFSINNPPDKMNRSIGTVPFLLREYYAQTFS